MKEVIEYLPYYRKFQVVVLMQEYKMKENKMNLYFDNFMHVDVKGFESTLNAIKKPLKLSPLW